MHLNMFDIFQSISDIIFIDAQNFLSLTIWSLLMLAPEVTLLSDTTGFFRLILCTPCTRFLQGPLVSFS